MVYGAPAPEPLPRLQPFKAPLYKSAHGKEWLPSGGISSLNTLLNLTQRLQDAYGGTAIMIPKLGHLDDKKKFEHGRMMALQAPEFQPRHRLILH